MAAAATATTEKGVAAIISDLGGVLIDVDKQNMCKKFAHHSSLSAKEIGRHFSPVVPLGLEIGFSKGLTTPQRFYRLLSRQLKLRGISFKDFNTIYSDRFSRKEDSIAVIRKLSKKYAVAMLSNTNELHYKYWAKTLGSDMKLFKVVILSFQAGYVKPDSRIFLKAARQLGVRPGQCVFIDDVEEYVEAARKVGMKGVRFVSAKQLREDLAAEGIRA